MLNMEFRGQEKYLYICWPDSVASESGRELHFIIAEKWIRRPLEEGPIMTAFIEP